MRFTKPIALALSLGVVALSFEGNAEAHHRQGHAAAAAVGFAAGALLGSALASPRYYVPAPVYVAPAPPPVHVAPAPVVYLYQPWTPDWYAYCGGKYRSFDPSTGYYLGYDGHRYFCR
jgi:hypothetical protein